jgi:hypothetical protein
MLLLLYSSASSLVMAVGALPLLSLPALHAPPPAAPIFSFLCLCSPPAQSRQATGRNCDQTARDDTRRLSRHAPVQLEASSSGVVADSPRTWIIAGKHLTSTQSSEIKTSKKHSHQTGNFGRSVAAHSPLRVGITIAMVGHPDALHRQRAPSAVRSGAPSKEASSMMEKPPRPGRRG